MVDKEGSLEEAAQSLQYMQQLYQNQYAELSREINAIRDYINELNASKSSLDNFGRLKGSMILSPVGSSIFINAKVSDEENVLVSIGAGYILEKKISEASEYVFSLINLQTKNMQELVKAQGKIEDSIFELSSRLEKLLKQA